MKKAFKILFFTIAIILSVNTLGSTANTTVFTITKVHSSTRHTAIVKEKKSDSDCIHKIYKLFNKQLLHTENNNVVKGGSTNKNRQNWHTVFARQNITKLSSSKLHYIKHVSSKLLITTRKKDIIYPFHYFW